MITFTQSVLTGFEEKTKTEITFDTNELIQVTNFDLNHQQQFETVESKPVPKPGQIKPKLLILTFKWTERRVNTHVVNAESQSENDLLDKPHQI